MRIVVQRVKSASVTVEGAVVSSIGEGLVGLVGLHERDTGAELETLARKLVTAKRWDNEAGKPWRQDVRANGREILLVSQFTLNGRIGKQGRPNYAGSMSPDEARAAYGRFKERVAAQMEGEGRVMDGRFGEMMDVALVNDGPVTIVLEAVQGEKAPRAAANPVAANSPRGAARDH